MDNVKWKLLKLISPHIRRDTLKELGIDINVNIHKNSKSDYEINNKITFNKLDLKEEDRQRSMMNWYKWLYIR